MPAPTIPSFSVTPSYANPDTFPSDANTFVGEIPAFINGANAWAEFWNDTTLVYEVDASTPLLLTNPDKVPTRGTMVASRLPDLIATGLGVAGAMNANDRCQFDTMVRNIIGGSFNSDGIVLANAGQYYVELDCFARRVAPVGSGNVSVGYGLYYGKLSTSFTKVMNSAGRYGSDTGTTVPGYFVPLRGLITIAAGDAIAAICRGTNGIISNGGLVPEGDTGPAIGNHARIWRLS